MSVPPRAAVAGESIRMGELQAGVTTPYSPADSPYDYNAYGIGQGQRLYTWYNCVGCHAQGGGDSGPPLMDAQWIYGGEPANIFASIVQGRPNGMPAFGGRIPDYQVWQLVAYVRSMSGLVPMDAAPGRLDGLQAKEPEQRKEEERPRMSGVPSGAER